MKKKTQPKNIPKTQPPPAPPKKKKKQIAEQHGTTASPKNAWCTGGQDVHRAAREHGNQGRRGALQQGQEAAQEEADLFAPGGLGQDLEVALL